LVALEYQQITTYLNCEDEVRRTMIKLLRVVAFLLCTAVSTPAMAQDFDEGMKAFNAGDDETALQVWRLLAEQGNARAQDQLGGLYSTGFGVIQDYAEAANWYRLAAEQGYADAQFSLGHAYDYGKGVTQDYAEAVDWYQKAAEQGHAWAQSSLGMAYYFGKGVIQEDVVAHMWTNISSANGHSTASAARGLVEERMTREQIAEAQTLARRCMASNYQDCD
jgi:TPR repeat protein